ncbi:hypothetical protein INR49_025485 [Caranx melampygus]|nr:hypothetical protein INR49_025485 [Caranx melampygus]
MLDVWTTAWPAAQQSQPQLKSRRSRQMSPLTTSSSAGNLSESAESKVERLGQAFKRNVRELREKSSCLDLVFLVDESSSVGANNFQSELRFVRKMLSDFPVAPEDTRVALVTFSSKTHVVTRVDHISAPKSHQHKCSLFNQEIPAINYRGGGTYTKGAFQRAAYQEGLRQGWERQWDVADRPPHPPARKIRLKPDRNVHRHSAADLHFLSWDFRLSALGGGLCNRVLKNPR